jgi:hypothetical protein
VGDVGRQRRDLGGHALEQRQQVPPLRPPEAQRRAGPVAPEAGEALQEAGSAKASARKVRAEEQTRAVQARDAEAAHLARPGEEHDPRRDPVDAGVQLEAPATAGDEQDVVEVEGIGPVAEVEVRQVAQERRVHEQLAAVLGPMEADQADGGALRPARHRRKVPAERAAVHCRSAASALASLVGARDEKP